MRVFRLPGELRLDEVLDLSYEERPLPMLTRDDVFAEGASHLLAGKAKSGKSTLLRALTYAWALDARSILYLSEESPRVWRKRAADLGFERCGAPFTVVPALGIDSDLLLERAARGPEQIVVVDTVLNLLGVSLRSDRLVPVLKRWVQICDSGKTVIFASHLTKRTVGTEIGAAIAGGFGVQALVDALIELHLDEHGGEPNLRLVSVRSRLLEEPVEFGIRKVGLAFEVVDRPGELIVTDAERDVLTILDPTAPKRLKEIMSGTGFREAKARRLLRELTAKRLVREVTGHAGRGGRGQEAAWVLVEEDPDEE